MKMGFYFSTTGIFRPTSPEAFSRSKPIVVLMSYSTTPSQWQFLQCQAKYTTSKPSPKPKPKPKLKPKHEPNILVSTSTMEIYIQCILENRSTNKLPVVFEDGLYVLVLGTIARCRNKDVATNRGDGPFCIMCSQVTFFLIRPP